MIKSKSLRLVLLVIVILGFMFPLAFSYLAADRNLLPKLEEALPEAKYFNKIAANPPVFEGYHDESHKEKVGYVAVGEGRGYGGPLVTVTGINLQGQLVGVAIVEHKDTPAFIQVVVNHKFLQEFEGKKAGDPLSLNSDIDRVSGATLSSRGITNGVAQASHAVAKNQLGLTVSEEVQPYKFGTEEAILVTLFILTLTGVIFRLTKLRWVTLIGGLIFIGFKFNTAVSLGNIAGVLMGYFPPLKEYIFWYIMFIGIPILTFAFGKNVYCYWLCPFGAVQEITAKIGGGKFHCHRAIETKGKKLKYGISYVALVIAFIYKSPSLSSYEPFAVLFAQNGFGVQWFLLPVVLFASFFVYRFWCNYFCPVGTTLDIMAKLRRSLNRRFRAIRKEKPPKSVGLTLDIGSGSDEFGQQSPCVERIGAKEAVFFALLIVTVLLVSISLFQGISAGNV